MTEDQHTQQDPTQQYHGPDQQPEQELEHHMEELGVESKISGVVSSDKTEESKPAPDIFGIALERAGADPEDAVAVGDSIWDIEAAKEAGVRVAAVMTGGGRSAAPSWRRRGPTRSTRTAPNCSRLVSPRSSTRPLPDLRGNAR